MAAEQGFKNHTRNHPIFHFFLAPLSLLLLLVAVARAFMKPDDVHIYLAVLSVAFGAAVVLVREYPLKVQDRIVRLEERLRLFALLPAEDKAGILSLTERQLIALRFASDEELPELAKRAWTENLSSKQIKAAITNWRADHFRV